MRTAWARGAPRLRCTGAHGLSTAVASSGTPLADAIRQGADRVFELLLKAKGQLGYEKAKMAGVLCDYAKEGRKEAIVQLLRAGGSVNAADYDSADSGAQPNSTQLNSTQLNCRRGSSTRGPSTLC